MSKEIVTTNACIFRVREGSHDMEHFKTWIAFAEPKSRKRLEVFWHSPCDHVGEWSTLYIGRDVTQSNPTVRQVLAFKHAFELMVK